MASSDMSIAFHWADYLVFALSLGVGLVNGLICLFRGRKNKTSEEYLLGGRDLHPVIVGASMLASALNAVFLLGGTAEVYYRYKQQLKTAVVYVLVTL